MRRASPALRRSLRAALGALLAPVVALLVAAAMTTLPPELRDAKPSESIRFVDREGELLREVRADDAMRARFVALEAMGSTAVDAVLAAEDRRFELHPGVDPLAVLRAAAQLALHRRVVSGASTLTMQLARLLRPHRRNVLGKLGEMALALRIEASLPKRAIVEQYMNRAPFGHGLRGIEAASRYYFDKPTRDLSLAEAAALAAIPRGPSVYDPTRHVDRVLRRRDRILDRMRASGTASDDATARAKAEPLVLRPTSRSFGAPHLVAALLADALPGVDGASPSRAVVTTIDRALQAEAEEAARAALAPLADRHVTADAVIVIDNATGDILAYVGSPDFADERRGGQNDGVRAARQPGSALKPFVYGLAIEKLGFTPATLLPDVELHLALPGGTYSPMNYDERFHGPVRLREALGSSLNVPAVWTADRLGAGAVLARLREVGLTSLDRSAEEYGPAIALGDGEVTLLELTNAYAAIARGGVWKPARAVRSDARREVTGEGDGEARRVMSRASAIAIADILADVEARAPAFGANASLDLPFEVAFKTGTSKGFRDNWTIGFTREVTVGVWAGNFDGSPMRGVSGITGAAPIFRAVIAAAMRGRSAAGVRLARAAAEDEGFARVEICALSGGRAGHSCARRLTEIIPRSRAADVDMCTLHERVTVDRRSGLRVSPGCLGADVVERDFETYAGTSFEAWAAAARRDVAPSAFAPGCAPMATRSSRGALRIGFPEDGSRFFVDPDRARATQAISIRVEAPEHAGPVDVTVDGSVVARVTAPYVASWPLARGEHVIAVEAAALAMRAAPVHVVVE